MKIRQEGLTKGWRFLSIKILNFYSARILLFLPEEFIENLARKHKKMLLVKRIRLNFSTGYFSD